MYTLHLRFNTVLTRWTKRKDAESLLPPFVVRLKLKMAQQFVQAKIKGDKVVLFIKPTCSYCITAREVLLKYKFKPGHLEFVDISARQDMNSMQDYFLELTGARTVPRVFIGEECVGGGSDVAELHKSGKLEGMLQSIGVLQ